jgi:DNA-binding MarR family transcriptional regulator
VNQHYLQAVLLTERLHRKFLDVVKFELDRLKIMDINNVQTMILYNIQDDDLTIGELTDRGYYLGSNVSYNVKKMVESDYLEQLPNPHDKRSTRVRLSPKGRELCGKIDAFFARHVEELERSDPALKQLEQAATQLRTLEQLWAKNMYV